MAAGGRDLQRASRLVLAAHLGQVGGGRGLRPGLRRSDRRWPPGSPEEPDDVLDGCHADHGEPVDLCCLDGVDQRDDDPAEPPTRRRDRDRDHTRGREDLALERDLTEEDMTGGGLGWCLPRRHQDAHGDREVEPRTFLPEVAGGEVDHHAAQRPFELRMFHRGSDPIPRILHGGAGEPGHGQRREASPDERLDRDRMAAHPEHGHADHPSVHATTLRPSACSNRDDGHTPVASPP